MARGTHTCKHCGGPLGSQYVRVEEMVLPHNPEWQIVLADAGLFCSRTCAGDYLLPADAREVTS